MNKKLINNALNGEAYSSFEECVFQPPNCHSKDTFELIQEYNANN